MPYKHWRLRDADPALKSSLENIGLSPLVAHILAARKFTPDAALAYLKASLQTMADPALLQDATLAAERLIKAAENQEKIWIYGDYDVDGITSTALLWLFLRDALGVRAHYYLPHRRKDGYGVTPEAVKRLHAQGAQLLVTVDNGSSAHKAMAMANELGLEVIIVDHHLLEGEEPNAFAHLNPHRPTSQYPEKALAAVGVVFLLLVELRRTMRRLGIGREVRLEDYLDLVALGTVADVMPLVNLNRAFVRCGLQLMRTRPRVGLRALMQVAKVEATDVTAQDIGFKLVPRLNAAGRIDDASAALALLLSENSADAMHRAQNLDAQNQERRHLEQAILAEALENLEAEGELKAAFVLAGESWHPGVLGIVASRLVDRFHRPGIVLTRDGERWKGSGRGVTGFDLDLALSQCSELLLSHGGHAGAAGVSLAPENLSDFRDKFIEVAADQNIDPELLLPTWLDAEVDLSELTGDDIVSLSSMSPFGQDNPEPCLRAHAVTGEAQNRNGHLFVRFHLKDVWAQGIAWGRGEDAAMFAHPIDLVFTPRREVWRGTPRFSFDLKAFAPANPKTSAEQS